MGTTLTIMEQTTMAVMIGMIKRMLTGFRVRQFQLKEDYQAQENQSLLSDLFLKISMKRLRRQYPSRQSLREDEADHARVLKNPKSQLSKLTRKIKINSEIIAHPIL